MDENRAQSRDQLFTNLKLLGFEIASMERKWRIPFKRDMFDLPNKEGFEAVIYFLFQRFHPVKCREMFRDCWPVRDKKQENQFRKVCLTWLKEISKTEACVQLPPVATFLFLSPSGHQLYAFLRSFSEFVLYKAMVGEHGVKEHDLVRAVQLTPDMLPMADAVESVLRCSAVRLRQRFMEMTQRTLAVEGRARGEAERQVSRYRQLTKKIRQLQLQCEEARQRAADDPNSSTSAEVRRCRGDVSSEVGRVHRAQRVERVRELWQTVTSFYEGRAHMRDVLDSVLEGATDKYCVDSRELNVRVPDLLMRECEDEIHRRGVQNIYEGGKLNMISLFHLFNLSLHLYIEKLHAVGLPDVEGSSPTVITQLQTHRAHLTNIHSLREKLEAEVTLMRRSIHELRGQFAERTLSGVTTDSPRCVPLHPRLHLASPTAAVSFQPADADARRQSLHVADTVPPVSTPDAARLLMESVDRAVHTPLSRPAALPQGSPVYTHNPQHQPRTQLPVRDGQRSTRAADKPGRVVTPRPGLRRGRLLPGQRSPTDGSPKVTTSGTVLAKTEPSFAAKKLLAARRSSPHHQVTPEPVTAMQRFVIGACDDDEPMLLPPDEAAFESHDRLARTPERVGDVSYPQGVTTRGHAAGVTGHQRSSPPIRDESAALRRAWHTNFDVDAIVDSVTTWGGRDVDAIVDGVTALGGWLPPGGSTGWTDAANVNVNNCDVREAVLREGGVCGASPADSVERLIAVHDGSFTELVVRTPKMATAVMDDAPVVDDVVSHDTLQSRESRLARLRVEPTAAPSSPPSRLASPVVMPTETQPGASPAVRSPASDGRSLAPPGGDDRQRQSPLESVFDSNNLQALISSLSDWPDSSNGDVGTAQQGAPVRWSVPLSPMTMELHSESHDDIFGEHDSLLLSSSPLGRLSTDRASAGWGKASLELLPPTAVERSDRGLPVLSPPTGLLLDL